MQVMSYGYLDKSYTANHLILMVSKFCDFKRLKLCSLFFVDSQSNAFFTYHYKTMLLSLICFTFVFIIPSSLQHCDHLLGKDTPLSSLVCDVAFCFVTFGV